MQTIYVLIMVFSTSASNGGVTTLTQEFNSRESCEYAMAETAKAHRPYVSELRAQGCFKK